MKNKPAQTSIVIIFFLVSFMALTTVIFNKVGTFKRQESKSITQDQSVHVAEAGIDAALYQLNQTSGSFTGETESVANVGQYTTTIAASGPSNRTITSTGCVPSQASCNSKQVITIDATSSGGGSTYNYSSFNTYDAWTGNGGISMSNSAEIHGPVFSNANITGGNQNWIYSQAYAVGTISNQLNAFGKHPNQSLNPLPDLSTDYDDWENSAAAGGSCPPVTGTITIGPCVYTGNLTIPNNNNVTINGVVHVTGNLSIVGSNIYLADSFGTSGTVIIVNGTISIGGNTGIRINSSNSEILFISKSDLPNVANPSTYAITVTNQQGFPTQVLGLYYAKDGGISLANSSDIGGAYAKSLKMINSADAGTRQTTTNFIAQPGGGGGGGGGAWTIKKGTYRLR